MEWRVRESKQRDIRVGENRNSMAKNNKGKIKVVRKVGKREVITIKKPGRASQVIYTGRYGKEFERQARFARPKKPVSGRERSIRRYMGIIKKDPQLARGASTITLQMQDKKPDKLVSWVSGQRKLAEYLYRYKKWEKAGKRGREPRGPS
jgi:hypothetical protein